MYCPFCNELCSFDIFWHCNDCGWIDWPNEDINWDNDELIDIDIGGEA